MIEIKEEFRYRLERALATRNIKPSELAKSTGISEATISQYRSGYSKPKDTRLVQIANCLHVDPSWLLGLDVPMDGNPAAGISSKLTFEEETIISAYRKAPELTKDAVANVLGVKREGAVSGSVRNNVG